MKERLAKLRQNLVGAELRCPAPWVDLTVRSEHQSLKKADACVLLLSQEEPTSLVQGALHTAALAPTPVVSGSCPAHCRTHLSVTSSHLGKRSKGAWEEGRGSLVLTWPPCTHNDQMRSKWMFFLWFHFLFLSLKCALFEGKKS